MRVSYLGTWNDEPVEQLVPPSFDRPPQNEISSWQGVTLLRKKAEYFDCQQQLRYVKEVVSTCKFVCVLSFKF